MTAVNCSHLLSHLNSLTVLRVSEVFLASVETQPFEPKFPEALKLVNVYLKNICRAAVVVNDHNLKSREANAS